MEQPLILLTNDDGIKSAGLWAAARALAPLGELLIVAPDRQWSGAGRSMPPFVTGALQEIALPADLVGAGCAFAVDATPALTVTHACTELSTRPPALVVSGINSGENLSTEITVSGTVGAALEGAASGIPGLAVSLEMPVSAHLTGQADTDYAAAAYFTRHFAGLMLRRPLPYDVNVLNINVPCDATAQTPWRLTQLSRRRYFEPLSPDRANGVGRPGYRVMEDPRQAEPDSDICAVVVERIVSVTPLSLDLTSRAGWGAIEEELRR